MNNDYSDVRIPAVPDRPVDVILDTDTFNEIDDQFAIAYMLHSPEKLRVKGITAAPFLNIHSESPGDGMEKSYQEILKLLRLDHREELSDIVFRGSDRFMTDENTPVDSPAARFIISEAAGYTKENPLYLASIGAITNIASALLLDPTIAEKIVIIWVASNGYHMPKAMEFNMYQDIAAARVVFRAKSPIVLIPADGVNDHLMTTEFELEHWLKGKNDLADYLYRNTVAEAYRYAKGRPWSRVIWDIAAIAWLLDDPGEMMKSTEKVSGFPEYDQTYTFSPENKPVCYVYQVNRDAIFEDLFNKVTSEM